MRLYSVNLLLVFSFLLFLNISDRAYGQDHDISGTVKETHSATPLTGATIRVFAMPDSVFVHGTTTDNDGKFHISSVEQGEYRLLVTYLGYTSEMWEFNLGDAPPDPFEIRLQPGVLDMSEIIICARQPRVEIRGDTTAFNADAYRVNPDASAEDLVRRMPGIVIQDGEVQAQGENVRRVTVDGEEFFGEDALLTLRNLPAEIIAEIQLIDDPGEQARFTGFSDGDTDRVMNIRTREGMNRGTFGRGNTGLGTNERYLVNGNFNVFNGSRRISFIGLTNNINQQNFSSEDLLGIQEASGGGGGRGRRGRGGGSNNFNTGGQSGVSSVHSLGVNYIDRWGDDMRINSSYFFNMSDNVNDQELERRYLSGFTQDQLYDEDSYSARENFNHRLNMRMEYQLDEQRSFIFTPRASFQSNSANRVMDAFTLDHTSALLNQIASENVTENSGYNVAGNLLYRHRFETEGRTFSANLRADINDRSGDRFQYDENIFYDESVNQVINDQQTETFTGGYTLGGDFSFTESVRENGQVMLSYQPSLNLNNSVQDAFFLDDELDRYTRLDTTLSNRYENQIMTQRGRMSYSYRADQFNVNVNLAYQYTHLTGNQSFPAVVETRQDWHNLLPGASIRYRFEEGGNIRLSYNVNTRTPSANQLQDVINNDDPLRIRAGNPNLDQQTDHRISLRYRTARSDGGTTTGAFASFGYTQDYIGNQTTVAQQDTELQEGIILGRGARFVRPDNIGEALDARSFLFHGRPLGFLRSNLNLNAGVSFRRTPSITDGERNLQDNLSYNAGTTISTNISPEVDISMSYRASYSVVDNSLQPELNNDYYTGRATASMNLQPWRGLVLASDMNMIHYEGLGEDFNRNTVYWNGSLGYKFLKDRAAELRLTVFDILAQNNNINRSISDDYIEDRQTNVLSRFALLTFSYQFRNFPGGDPARGRR